MGSGYTEHDPPEAINVVLTFADAGGRRWLAGALLGPLVAVDRMPDVALTLVSFMVVHGG